MLVDTVLRLEIGHMRRRITELTHFTVLSSKTCFANTLVVIFIVNRSTELRSSILTWVVHARCLLKIQGKK